MKKKTFIVPAMWTVTGVYEVEAFNVDEAISIVNNPEMALPDNEEYLDGTFEIDVCGVHTVDNDYTSEIIYDMEWNLCEEIGKFYGDIILNKEKSVICVHNGERMFMYNSPNEMLSDWLDTLIQDKDTDWADEIEFIQKYCG